MTSKHIVTGAAGFIGSTLAQRLLNEGHHVVGVDSLTDYYAESIKRDNLRPLLANDRFSFLESPIRDVNWAETLEGAEAVYHQAAQAGVRASWGREFALYTELNIDATQILLEALKGRSTRLVYASSSSVYGDTPILPMREDHRPQPHSPYGVTKLAAEHLSVLYWRNFGVHTVSLRYFTVYGPKQRPDMAFHRFIKAVLQGREITLYGDGDQTRDFTFVDDIVEANLRAARLGAPGGVYNLGGGSTISVNDVLPIIGNIVGRPVLVKRFDTQKGDVRHTSADTSRAREELGFDPQTPLAEGLAAEVAWIENSLPLLV
jgi:nucleoside-diphosphate-sugar epimerase